MHFLSSPIPSIEISPAPVEEVSFEPYSPFSPLFTPNTDEEDGFRALHLTPPPTASDFKRVHSPLRPSNAVSAEAVGKGLDNQRFQTMLRATKERPTLKKDVDLRKEIAQKAHKNKQMERRALFLSKVLAPPSPTAATLPKTPPESPAIFHYSLPSPGLVSPLALFETLGEDKDSAPKVWVEQVDFRLPEGAVKAVPQPQTKPTSGLPSLDQISARLMSRNSANPAIYEGLQARPAKATVRPSLGVGRLRMPLRTTAENQSRTTQQQPPSLPPKSPLLHLSPELRVTTLLVPHTYTPSPAKLTETNLNALNSRGQTAHNMLSTLRRRTTSMEHKTVNYSNSMNNATKEVQYKWRRRSAPADLMALHPRTDFEHPVLKMPGGF
ncbi:hypothetical protein CVT24_005762 [Panaeolus cyanescens]|uniref:Uncharacterized protein n=1 Tax=Panaeolus cyanescens TaxID=181874 RepID=A0A409YF47_9AGAR|nr:hypothetical protein CVT24_005762 [Panaeolus cyanescens]